MARNVTDSNEVLGRPRQKRKIGHTPQYKPDQSPGLTYMYVCPGSTGRSPNTSPWSGHQRKACHHKSP